jgi:hypothetical protein
MVIRTCRDPHRRGATCPVDPLSEARGKAPDRVSLFLISLAASFDFCLAGEAANMRHTKADVPILRDDGSGPSLTDPP